MKTSVRPSLVQMDPNVLQELILEVKETIASCIQLHEKPRKAFTTADMWNIRKKERSAGTMVRRW